MLGVFAKNEPKSFPCKPGELSFYFDLIQKYWGVHWAAAHQLCSLMRRMGACRLTIEILEVNPIIAGEISIHQSALAEKLKINRGKIKSKVFRVSFFRTKTSDWWANSPMDLLGYAVVVSSSFPKANCEKTNTFIERYAYICDSVLRVPHTTAPGADATMGYYAHCIANHKTVIGTHQNHRQFTIKGGYFCQPPGMYGCGWAAVKMAIANYRQGGKIIPTMEMEEVLGLTYTEAEKDGSSVETVTSVLNHFGIEHIKSSFKSRIPRSEYTEFVYPLIDSRMPVILGLESHGLAHMVNIIGHTSNFDRWAVGQTMKPFQHFFYEYPEYLSASCWMDHLIANDNEAGMYIGYPTDLLRTHSDPHRNPNVHATIAIALVEKQVGMTGLEAERQASRWLKEMLKDVKPTPRNYWLTLLIKAKHLVLRTVLLNKSEYIEALAEMRDSLDCDLTDELIEEISDFIPQKIWLVEVTLPGLFCGNKRKLGEIIVDASDYKDLKDMSAIRFCWLPSMSWFRSSEDRTKPPWAKGIKEGRVKPSPWPLDIHVGIYRLKS